MTETRTYRCWQSMIKRCHSSYKQPCQKDYADKGIAVCERWRDFRNFFCDMGLAPTETHQIDRIDSLGDYEPGNCRWVTPSENSLNRKSTRWITYDGRTLAMSHWANELGMSIRTLKARIDYMKWPLERALTERVN